MTTAAVVPPQEPGPLSEGQRLVDVFFAPSKTFTDLRRNASWWAPFLITAIVSLLFVYTVDQKVGFRKVAENQLQSQPKQADQVERMPPISAKKPCRDGQPSQKYSRIVFPSSFSAGTRSLLQFYLPPSSLA